MAGIFVVCRIQCSIQNLSWLKKTTLGTKNSLAMATEVSISVYPGNLCCIRITLSDAALIEKTLTFEIPGNRSKES